MCYVSYFIQYLLFWKFDLSKIVWDGRTLEYVNYFGESSAGIFGHLDTGLIGLEVCQQGLSLLCKTFACFVFFCILNCLWPWYSSDGESIYLYIYYLVV